ncbi:MAG: hypothetical protein IJQ98_05295, partial [Oscillospiraceae bacterium]|nr:hypothetical protein [Oscillospiraceae bacterium]
NFPSTCASSPEAAPIMSFQLFSMLLQPPDSRLMFYGVIRHFLLIFSLLLNTPAADQDSFSVLPFDPHWSAAVRAKHRVLAASIDKRIQFPKIIHAFWVQSHRSRKPYNL